MVRLLAFVIQELKGEKIKPAERGESLRDKRVNGNVAWFDLLAKGIKNSR